MSSYQALIAKHSAAIEAIEAEYAELMRLEAQRTESTMSAYADMRKRRIDAVNKDFGLPASVDAPAQQPEIARPKFHAPASASASALAVADS